MKMFKKTKIKQSQDVTVRSYALHFLVDGEKRLIGASGSVKMLEKESLELAHSTSSSIFRFKK